jgi:hypothetical protein
VCEQDQEESLSHNSYDKHKEKKTGKKLFNVQL